MKILVIGAGLGGLGTALRLQGAGHDVTVLEQLPTPGGRASQIVDGRYVWDTGPSLITMPWVLEETFAAGGLNFRDEVDLLPLEPYYRIHWAGDDRHLDVMTDRDGMRDELAKFSAHDARAFDGFLDALRPIYEEGILAAGRRSFDTPLSLAGLLPTMVRLGAALPLHTFVSRHFDHERVREAMGFHSLFIGGDPFRVPAIYGALVYLQFLDGVHYTRGGVYSVVEAMARHLDVRTSTRVERIEHRGGRVRGVVTDGGELIEADAVVWNGDAAALDGMLGVRRQLRSRRSSMSALLVYLGTDRQFPQLRHHTLMVGTGYKRFIKDVTSRRRLAANYSTYIHAPSRTEPGMAADGGDSIAILLPVPNLRSGDTWDDAQTQAVADGVIADLEETFGVEGLAESTVVRHTMTPADFRDRYAAVDGNAFALEPTLHQSAAFRVPNRHPKVRGVYAVGGGSHPGAGVPGVLFGAEVTAGLIAQDHPRPTSFTVPPGASGTLDQNSSTKVTTTC
ncbi:MAG: phytoene desaturase family protein [Patulibacter minatonensis]